jgi:hypothetical protein
MSWPADIDTPGDLLVALNNWSTTTTGPINETNVDIGIANGDGLQATDGLVSIGSEVIKYSFIEQSGGVYVLRDCDRGYDGTSPQQHGSGARVELRWVAEHHNRLAQAIIAMQTALGVTPTAAYDSLAERLENNLPTIETVQPASTDWSFSHDRRRLVTVQLWRLNSSTGRYEEFEANVEQELNPAGPATVTISLGSGNEEEGFIIVL